MKLLKENIIDPVKCNVLYENSYLVILNFN